MATITTPVKRFVVFQMLISPKKFAEAISTSSGKTTTFDPKNKKDIQVLLSEKNFRIEYNPRIMEITAAPEEPKTYEDVIIAQCGLPPLDKNGHAKSILYALVLLNKKSLREFSRWLGCFMTTNKIPLGTKDGEFRISFHNGVGIDPDLLASLGFSAEGLNSNRYVFVGDEIVDKPKPKTNKKPSSSKEEDKPDVSKLTNPQRLEILVANLSRYLKNELKATPVMVIKDSDVAKAICLDQLPYAFMRKLQDMLNERFATQFTKDEDGSVSLIVWRPSKKRVPVGAMKLV